MLLVLDIMVNSMLRILKGNFVEFMEFLNKDAKKKKGWILYIEGRDYLIATDAKLLYIKHESYGISGDLIEIIN